MNSLLEALIAAKLSGSGGGGGAAVLYTQQTLTDAQQEQARANIGAVSLDEIGTVFTLKGGVATVGDLPASGNSVGDVYYVEAVSAGYIWLTSSSQPNGYWEELGETFDVTVDSEISATSENPVQNKVINAALATKGTYSKPSGGIPKSDLASTVQTSLGKADTALQVAPVASVNGRTGVVVLGANDVGALPSDTPIPAAVTEQTVSGWGFTKNTGTYTKPSGGIPKTDLASAVQKSLKKADTALQSVPTTYRTATAQDEIDDAQDAKINKKANTADLAKVATTGSYNDLSDKPTIPSLSGYATEMWVTEKGYQTAAQVQTAISGVRQLPVVSASDNGKFLRVVSGAWTAATVPSAETASF